LCGDDGGVGLLIARSRVEKLLAQFVGMGNEVVRRAPRDASHHRDERCCEGADERRGAASPRRRCAGGETFEICVEAFHTPGVGGYVAKSPRAFSLQE
jgi:hypothetical protein